MTGQKLTGPRALVAVAPAGNFPVALRVLPAATRRDLLVLYDYARFVHDLGDERVATTEQRLAALDWLEVELHDLYRGRPPCHRVLCRLAPTIASRRLPLDPLVRLIEANRVDQVSNGYATFRQLVGYCTLCANPVGELVLHIFDQATPGRIELSDRICTALQLIEHLQNLSQDWRRGRVYLPTEDLDRFGVHTDDLGRLRATLALRDLVAFEAERARAWLDAGAPLVSALRGWARLAVGGYIAGGRAALDALQRSGYGPLPGPRRPSRSGVLSQWLRATTRSAG